MYLQFLHWFKLPCEPKVNDLDPVPAPRQTQNVLGLKEKIIKNVIQYFSAVGR